MKKITLLFTITLLFSTVLKAQKIAAEAGLNLATMIDNDFDDDNKRFLPGFHVRGIFEMNFNDYISAQAGMGLSQKGLKFKFVEDEFSYTSSMSLYYLDMPILFKGGIPVGDGKIYGCVGPNFGLALFGMHKYKSTYNGETETDTDAIDFEDDDIARFDFGIKSIFGYETGFGLYTQFSYEFGITDVEKHSTPPLPGTNLDKTRNSVIGISVGYLFGL